MYPVLYWPYLLYISIFSNEPQVFGETYLLKNKAQRIDPEYFFPFFLDNSIDLAPCEVVDRYDNILNLGEYKLLH